MTQRLVAEATSLIDEAARAAVPLRLVGGLAVRVLCPGLPSRTRDGQDLDLASLSRRRRETELFLTDRGFDPDRNFNALHGHKQLYFRHRESGRALDVLLDRVEMCHSLEFKDRLERLPHTLDVGDLLLSKLQIVQINAKDVQDALYLLGMFSLSSNDEPGSIGLGHFAALVGNDWGWWRTVTTNLDLLADAKMPDGTLARMNYNPREQAATLRRIADECPKSRRWKLRARVGERVRWYEVPEEEAHE
jgi:hypothetical protein